MADHGGPHFTPFTKVYERHAGLADGGGQLSRRQAGRASRQSPLLRDEIRRLRTALDSPSENPPTRQAAIEICWAADAVLPKVEVAAALGLSLTVVRQLVGRRLLRPTWDDPFNRDWFYRLEIVEFRERVMAKALPPGAPDPTALTMATLQGFKIRAHSALSAVLAGAVVPTLSDDCTLAGLLFARDDVDRIIRFDMGGTRLSVRSFADANALSNQLLAEIRSRKLVHVFSHAGRMNVDIPEAEAFAARFVSAAAIVRKTGVDTRIMNPVLEGAGCTPIIETRDGRLYERHLAAPIVEAVVERLRSAR